MSEIKIVIEAPEICKAINVLAEAIRCKCCCDGKAEGETPTNEVTPELTLGTAAPVFVAPASVASAVLTPTQPVQQSVVPVAPTAAPVQQAPTAAPTVVPTAMPQYSLDDLARAGTALVDAGKMSDLLALLAKFGVDALTSLNPAQYGAMAIELRQLGAQI